MAVFQTIVRNFRYFRNAMHAVMATPDSNEFHMHRVVEYTMPSLSYSCGANAWPISLLACSVGA
jgi:hypothetical protein